MATTPQKEETMMSTHTWHVVFDPRGDADHEVERIARAIDASDVTINYERCTEHHCITLSGPDADHAATKFADDIRDPEEAIISVTCSACGTDATLPQHTCKR